MTMKKFLILFAAVTLLATTACNEKPAKDEKAKIEKTAPENQPLKKIDPKAAKAAPMTKVGPTEDGKDHMLADFNTKEYNVKLENLANGTMRVTLKGGNGDQVYESNNCRVQGDSYLMQTTDGKNILMNAKEGKIVILNKKEIVYSGIAVQ